MMENYRFTVFTIFAWTFFIAISSNTRMIKGPNEIYIDAPCQQDSDILIDLIWQLGFSVNHETIANKIKHFLHDKFDKMWVAKINEEVIGVIAINIINPFYTEKLFARIDTVIVHERYRKLGIGKLLVRVAEDYAKNLGCSRIFLTSGNHRSETHKFYEHLGFVSNATYFVKNL